MTFFDEGKVVVRAAVNEMQTKTVNPSVPYGPEEVSRDAIACAGAGAAMVHFHSRTDDGAQALDDDSNGAHIYRQAIALTAAKSDVIMEPTNHPRGNDPSLAIDTPQFWSLCDEPPDPGQLEVVNIDGFRFGRAAQDTATQRLATVGSRRTGVGEPFLGPEVIRETLRRGLVPCFGVFDLGEVRMLSAFVQSGIVKEPVLMQINFFFDMVIGPTPSVQALDSFLTEWRRTQIDAEVFLFVRAMSDRAAHDALFTAAMDRGVHPRVGLGDNPHLFSSNADAVEHMVQLAERQGLTPASSAELRRRVGLETSIGE